MVTGEYEHILRVISLYEADVLIDGVGGAGKPGALLPGALVGRQYVHSAVGHVQVPGLAVAYVTVELKGPVLGQDTHGVDPGVCAVGEGKVDYTILSAKGNAGFRHFLCQCIKS